jgi:hypothetical protein
MTIFKDRIFLDGKDPGAFSVQLDDDLIVQAGYTKYVPVKFTPTDSRDYSATLHLVNSLNLDVKINLTGSGDIIHLSTKPTEINTEPGKTKVLPVYAEIVKLEKDTVRDMKFDISFDATMVTFKLNTFVNKINDWTWDTPVVNNTKLEISGSGKLPTPFKGELFEIGYSIYLGDSKESEIRFQPVVASCDIPDTLGATVKLSDVCFVDGRMIIINKAQYKLQSPQPNPASENISFDFGVGLKALTTIDLYNSMGIKVKTLINDVYAPGYYSLQVPTNEFASGVYMLKMQSGPFSSTASVVISK